MPKSYNSINSIMYFGTTNEYIHKKRNKINRCSMFDDFRTFSALLKVSKKFDKYYQEQSECRTETNLKL